MSVAVDDVIGRYVGGYRIVRELGSGGFGTVYLAENDVNGRRYAIKVLAQWAAADRGPLNLRERFIQEAKAGGALEHDNIVQVTDIAAFADGRPYLVMPYIEGDELDVYCVKVGGQWGHPGRLAAEMALPLLLQILSALRYTHQRNIVHRDLKSNNIIIAPGKRPGSFPTAHVLDFGIAKVLDPRLRVMKGVTTQIVLGSMGYMSPEQARGMRVDHRTDIYAIGIILYKMIPIA